MFSFGRTTNNYTVASLEQWHGVAHTPAALAGLEPGDTIVSINGKTFADPNSMTDVIKRSTGKQLELGVERNGRLIHLTATPRERQGHHGRRPDPGQPRLPRCADQAGDGVGRCARRDRQRLSPRCGRSTDQEVTGLAHTFSPSGINSVFHQVTNSKAAQSVAREPRPAPRPVSIVGIANLGAQTEQAGIESVLMLLIAINIVFALLNMLPMIPLDGGHVAVAAYEWIRTKKGEPYYKADITKLFPVAAVFMAFSWLSW